MAKTEDQKLLDYEGGSLGRREFEEKQMQKYGRAGLWRPEPRGWMVQMIHTPDF